MEAILDALQDAVAAEPEAGEKPGTAQPGNATNEAQPTEEICTLWSDHVRLAASRKATTRELRHNRARLAERLHEMKTLLACPGRGGQWSSWLREKGIRRSTADRLAARYAEVLETGNGDSALAGAIPASPEESVGKLAKSVWRRSGKLLATDDAVARFISRIADISGVGHEQRDEGLLIFMPAPKAADEVPASAMAASPAPQAPEGGGANPADAPTAEPAPQPSCETPASIEQPAAETAAAPPAAEQAAAVPDAGKSDAASPDERRRRWKNGGHESETQKVEGVPCGIGGGGSGGREPEPARR
jgi:hypothetical protein